jgi:hypothetical protein
LAFHAIASCGLVAVFALGALLIDPARSEAESSIESAAAKSFDSALVIAKAQHDDEQLSEQSLAKTWAARQQNPKSPREKSN